MTWRPAPPHSAHGVGTYAAEFSPSDADELVRAALSCPYCLGAVNSTHLVHAAGGPVAELICASCEQLWQVELDLAQTLRLLLSPPAKVSIMLGPQAACMRELARITEEDIGS
ncbi:MAG: hypothetical protein ACR2ND_05680 [Solirubrobacteraceae bacterium]